MIYKIKQGIVLTKMGKLFVAYDNDNSMLHELNESAYVILEAIKGGKSKSSIIEKMIDEYKASEIQISKDYDALVSALLAKKIIVSK